MPDNSASKSSSIRRLYERLRARANVTGLIRQPEQEQGILRVAITAFILLYLLVARDHEDFANQSWQTGIEIVVSFLIYSVLLLAGTMIWPKPSRVRRVVGVLGDTGITTLALYMTGPVGATWYGVYLWVTLGYGFRYGEKYLYLSGALSLAGFGGVVWASPFWQQQPELAIGLTATLLVIPAYSAILIRRLNEARQRADDASRAKSDFLSRMSHEIRTPLNGILGMTDLLRTRPLDAEEKEYVETIHASGKMLARQIDEILDLSKIEAGQLVLENIDFDLYALIHTTLRIFDTRVSEKQIQLRETVNPNTPFLLSGDPHKLRQVLINMVGNAVKFTEQGCITVNVFPREQDHERVVVRFEVSDTGTGIDPDKLQCIFEPFTQASASVSRTHGGTGLGTTICKNLIELMDGEIGVESVPGAGTTFWFEIPFVAAGQRLMGKDLSWTRDCKVLYLPHGLHADSSIDRAIQNWKLQCTPAGNLDELRLCLAQARDAGEEYDALLVNGPVWDEPLRQLMHKLTCDKLFSSLCVVLVGGETPPADVSDQLGDRQFALSTPVDDRVLFNALHACYSRHSTEDDVIHIARRQVHEQRVARHLEVLIADDNSTNRLVLQRMLNKLGYGCTAVSGGEAVLTMLEDRHFDVVIVDKNMPDMGGLEVFQAWSMAHAGRGKARFIVLTADATPESRDACSAAGIEHFLTKPVSLAALGETLFSVSEGGQGDTDEIREVPEIDKLSSQQDNNSVLDHAELHKLEMLGAGNTGFMAEMVENFRKDAARDLLELESAVGKRDWTAFRDSAHALKGSAMYLGLNRLSALCLQAQNIEQEEFLGKGIQHLQGIQKASTEALDALGERLACGHDSVHDNSGSDV